MLFIILELTSSKLSVLKDSASPRLLDGSSGTQDSKELLTADSNTWQQEGSSNSQDSKQDHPFARSKLGTVKKASGEGVAKSSAGSIIITQNAETSSQIKQNVIISSLVC